MQHPLILGSDHRTSGGVAACFEKCPDTGDPQALKLLTTMIAPGTRTITRQN
jgi:hypothetical protein